MSEPKLSRSRGRIPVLLLEGIHEDAVRFFHEHGYSDVTRVKGALPPDELKAALSRVRLVGLRSRTQLTEEMLDAAPQLLAIGCFCIGTNQVDLDAAAQRGIPVFNAPHSNTRSVAELVLGLSVMLLRGIHEKSVAAHRGEWRKSATGAHELRGKTLGIVGYGHIGAQVSILAEAFGMRVIFHDILSKLPLGNARAVGSLEEVLAQSDLVTLHVPQTRETMGMMGAEQLDAMRPGSHLINASRGTVVDIDALTERLRSGHIAGAAVDVFPKEPATKDEEFQSALRGLDNVILTPHIGGSTLEAQQGIATTAAAKLVAYSDRGTTQGAVNFPELRLTPHLGCHRVLHVHHNRPGVLSRINDLFAERRINIVGQHLQTRGDIGYVVFDIEEVPEDQVIPPLRAIPETIRARILF